MNAVDALFTTQMIRTRCGQVFEKTLAGQGVFELQLDQLSSVAKYVAQVTRENFSDLKVPPHSRWSHFQVGGVDRLRDLRSALASLPAKDRAASLTDLVIVSVLLDAGAGPDWSFTDSHTGQKIGRSEGLALASLELFLSGAFSSDSNFKYQVDAAGLEHLSLSTFSKGFQISASNPLVGLEGRFQLLQSLGKALRSIPMFGHISVPRPGSLVWHWWNLPAHSAETHGTHQAQIAASQILASVLKGLGPIWPSRLRWEGVALGDVWSSALLGLSGTYESLVPFHKLSQWLTFSLLHPAEESGLRVTGLNELTGLPEYRNGGLFLDFGVIKPRNPQLFSEPLSVDSEAVVQWRALTVTLLDRLADMVRQELGVTSEIFPLPAMLEGGSWRAGRKIAAEKRPGGSPPFSIISDGTVF